MSSSVVLKALGMNTSPNQLELPAGSMTEASNVIIRRSDVCEPRRGFAIYGNSFGSSTDVASQLFTYKDIILRQFNTTLQFDANDAGNFESFSGSYTQAQAGLRTKSIESNGNLYFTSSDGIQTISALNASQLTTAAGYIYLAGVPKAIDLTGIAVTPPAGTIGFMPQDSAVAYRTTWALIDANNNLNISSPSQPIAVYSSLLTLLVPNYMALLEAMNNIEITAMASFFTSGYNYVANLGVTSSQSSQVLYTNLLALGVQLDNDIIYANGNGSGAVPLTISAASAPATNTLRITFTSDPSAYFTTTTQNRFIQLAGFTDTTTPANTKLINAPQEISAIDTVSNSIDMIVTGIVSGDTITFAATNATTIKSYQFEQITDATFPASDPGVALLIQDNPPSNQELVSLQSYISTVTSYLGQLPTVVLSSFNVTTYITPLSLSTSTNVELTIDIPQGITTSYFLQVYRSQTVTATGTDVLADLVPNSEETQLVMEVYPTAAQIAAHQIIVTDITPDIFKGANLYTNESTGLGIAYANERPPFALDINRYKNVTFYANTKTVQQIAPFNMIGVANMVTDAQNGIVPEITIANTLGISNTYKFVLGVQQITQVTAVAKSAITSSSYFYLNSAENATEYYVWADKTGTDTDPMITGKTGIRVLLSSTNIVTPTDVAARYRDVINAIVNDFTVTSSGANFTITNVNVGFTTNASAQTSGFTVTTPTEGAGESAGNLEVLLSPNISPALAVDATARSLVRVINTNSNETIYAYYTATIGQIPGQMVLQSRNLNDTPFYIVANDDNTGDSFSPSLDPDVVSYNAGGPIISVGNPTVLSNYVNGVLTNHGLVNNEQIIITGSDSTPSINGIYAVTVLTPTTFSIPVNVTVAGTMFSYSNLGDAPVSKNDVKPNRIYYSQLGQPEAVPLVNYLDVGDQDKAIERIFPLRDSLFVLKQDGLFRISSDAAPFYLDLFDSSCVCIAPDSVAVANNLIYAWTQQGIVTISEAGVSVPPISRPIDTEILAVSSDSYTNFGTATWGVGYDSDNNYIVFTVQQTTDTQATIGYRYNNLTNTWTTIDKSSVCGIVNFGDDKLYLGAGDVNFIEQERKNFNRTDYADRQIAAAIANGGYQNSTSTIQLSSVKNMNVGDVVEQNQLVTVYKFNALLQKLDIDPGLASVHITAISVSNVTLTITAAGHNLTAPGGYVTINNNTSVPNFNGLYFATYISSSQFSITIAAPLVTLVQNGTVRYSYYNNLQALPGDNLRTDLLNLTAKLDTDPNTVTKDYATLIASLTGTATAIAVGNPTHVTSTANGLLTGRYISITGSDSAPVIDGDWTISLVNSNTFSVPTNVNTAGTVANWVTLDNSFQDIEGCYNIIINALNSDSGLAFKNYQIINSDTSIETVIIAINTNTNQLTLGESLAFVVGPITVYNAIASSITYAPNTIGDPLGLKHMQEATIMFTNKAFTSATLSFASDLLPAFQDVPFTGAGNGIFGNSGVFGDNYFGGLANSAPMRTYFPRSVQRCRYSVIQFSHQIARESYGIYGITISGLVGQSTRAYR